LELSSFQEFLSNAYDTLNLRMISSPCATTPGAYMPWRLWGMLLVRGKRLTGPVGEGGGRREEDGHTIYHE